MATCIEHYQHQSAIEVIDTRRAKSGFWYMPLDYEKGSHTHTDLCFVSCELGARSILVSS